jgi:predicted RND superfamily exporter protein
VSLERVFKKIIDHKILVVVVFALLSVVCIFLSKDVRVNNNFIDYLPEDSRSTVALDVMDAEYGGVIPNARIMVKGVDVPQALAIKAELQGIDGVDDITWLDDAVNIFAPLEAADSAVVTNYYKDGNALFTVTVDTEKSTETLGAIREQMHNYDYRLAGSAVDSEDAETTVSSEIMTITLIAIPLCFLILLLTTSSFFEPVLFLTVIGVAILLNRGTNIFFGEISFVTNSAQMILQLAVSMDYSIFLLHRFSDYRKDGIEIKSAMTKAVADAFSTITASGVTTVIGFAALILMRFRIGADLGVVLAKGVVLSMISVLALLPVLTLIFYKLIDRTHHKPLPTKFEGFAKVIAKIKVPALILFLLILAPVYLAQSSNNFFYGVPNVNPDGSEVVSDETEINDVFGKSNLMVLLVPKGNFADEKLMSDELHSIPEVSEIISYVDTIGAEVPPEFIDADLLSNLLSENYSRMILTVNADSQSESTFALVKKIQDTASVYYGDDWYLAGDSPNTYDLKITVTSDMVKVNLIAIGAVFIVLLLTFRSLTLPLFLVLTIESAIWVNLSFPYFGGQTIFYICYLIISSIQLGATVDYAILFAGRYMTERKTSGRKQALRDTLTGTTLSILTSGSILTLGGLVLGFVSTNGALSQLGTFVGRGAVLSVVMVLTVLPALLYFFDSAIAKTTQNANFVKESN